VERRKGYAAQNPENGPSACKKHRLSRVMLGCYSDNLLPSKPLKSAAASLAETKPLTLDGRPMNDY
jgi:predicted acetyltransferase